MGVTHTQLPATDPRVDSISILCLSYRSSSRSFGLRSSPVALRGRRAFLCVCLYVCLCCDRGLTVIFIYIYRVGSQNPFMLTS